jgi:hypothetical protein
MTFIFDGVKVQTSYFPEVLIIFMQIPQAVTAVTQQRPKRFLQIFRSVLNLGFPATF